MLSRADVSGSRPAAHGGDEIPHHAHMAADLVGRIERREPRRPATSTNRPLRSPPRSRCECRHGRPRESVPLAPTMRHAHSQLVREALRAPAAAIGEEGAVFQIEQRRSPTSLAGTRSWPGPIRGNRRLRRRGPSCSASRRNYGSPCRAAAHGPSLRESRRNAERGRNRRGRW